MNIDWLKIHDNTDNIEPNFVPTSGGHGERMLKIIIYRELLYYIENYHTLLPYLYRELLYYICIYKLYYLLPYYHNKIIIIIIKYYLIIILYRELSLNKIIMI